MSVTSCAASVLKIFRVLVRLEYIASFIVNANHKVSTEAEKAREPLQPATAGKRADLRRRALAQNVANKHSGSFERAALSAIARSGNGGDRLRV